MIVGVGIDLVGIARIDRLHGRYGQRFARRLLAGQEWAEYRASRDPVRLLAKRFAAKEAAAKALGTGIARGIRFGDLWTAHDPAGAPLLRWDGKARERAEALGVVQAHLSLSDERDHVVACVILER